MDINKNLGEFNLDAIVVPTNRSHEYLNYALELSKVTNAFLLVFVSGYTSVTAVTARIISNGVRGLAVNIPTDYRHPLLLGFKTDNFSMATQGRAASDVSLKRNLGLLVGRMMKWSNLLFLDDDITNIKGMDTAVKYIANTTTAGFLVNKFPDNSVVRHAERLSGIEPGVKLSAGALMVNPGRITTFFPNIYNEDWFFLYGSTVAAPCPIMAGTADQRPYNPFKTLSRASSEEFGDLLAEGMLQLTENNLDPFRASVSDWQHLLIKRKRLIKEIQERLQRQAKGSQTHAAMKSLTAAADQLNNIKPLTCALYMKAWSRDLDLFQERIALLSPHGGSVTQIITAAGLLA